MDLRHLRYFIAVAEEGSLTNAADRRLHTAQPSLSRQIRDLELEVGVKLLERGARGTSLTDAGRVFLDHARLALLQVEAAGEAARRAAQPEKAAFVIGFLTGHEVVWLPEVLRILRDEEPNIGYQAYVKSEAVLRIARELPRWQWTWHFHFMPRVIRDAIYDLVARNRYRWFGRRDACMLPNSDRSWPS